MSAPAPIRVLLVNHVSRCGGAERGLLDIVGAVAPRTAAFTVVLPGTGPLDDVLTGAGVPLRHAPLRRLYRTRNPWRLGAYAYVWLRAVRRLAHIIRDERIALVHANSTTAHLFTGAAAARAGVPCLWHCRDLVPLGALGPRLARSATRILAISDAVAADVARYAPAPGRVVKLANGFDVAAYAPRGSRSATRDALGLPPHAFVVTMVAAFIPWKRHDLFLDAAARVAAELPEARFLVVGDDRFGDHPGTLAALRQRAAETHLAGRVVFAGFQADMAPVYEASDALLHPAAREPFGRAVAEAMCAGLPVVAVADAGPRELIRDGRDGLLAPPGDVARMADALCRLGRDPALRQRLGAAARTRIADAFSLTAFGHNLSTIYRDVTCK